MSVRLRRIVGSGRLEALVGRDVRLPFPADEILEFRRTVTVREADIVPQGVILKGEVRSRCFYVAPERAEPRAHRAELDDLGHGRLLVKSTDIPFDLHLPVAGAKPGMGVTLTAAHVGDDASQVVSITRRRRISRILDRSLLVLGVRVWEETQARR